jgi:hypothetical protein
VIQAAGLHLHHDFAGFGLGLRHIAEFKFSRFALGDKLQGFIICDLRYTIGERQTFLLVNQKSEIAKLL